MTTLAEHFRTLARYNQLANERVLEAAAQLSDEEYRQERFGSFGSIHRTLNHILLADRIWMGRLESAEITRTPALGTILYEEFERLREARIAEDERIVNLMSTLDEAGASRSLQYYNSAGVFCSDSASLAIAHMFNHGTHHRGQLHVMLSQTGLKPLSLDMHRLIRPVAPQ